MAKRTRGRALSEPEPTTERVARQTRRRPTRRPSEQGLLDRYRSLLVAGVAVLGVLIIGFLFLQGATRAAYECRELLTPGPVETLTPPPATPVPSPTPEITPTPEPTPGPTPDETPDGTPAPEPSPTPEPTPTLEPSPTPEPTPRLGFPTTDLGRAHAPTGAGITYDYCPPASGAHYAQVNVAPMPPAVYPPAQERAPGYWVHNLEHGYVVLLYRCASGTLGEGDCPTRAEMERIEAWFNQAPDPPVSTCPTKVMAARFDAMETRFALLAWDRVLLVDEFDLDQALIFAEQWMEYDQFVLPERTAC